MPKPSSHVCDLLIINQYYTPLMFYCENACSKQVRNYFLVFSSLIIIARLMLYYKKCVQNKRALLFSLLPYLFDTKKCVFKASRNLRFRLLSYFSNTNVCSKRAGCFLTYSTTFQIQKMFVQNKREAAF